MNEDLRTLKDASLKPVKHLWGQFLFGILTLLLSNQMENSRNKVITSSGFCPNSHNFLSLISLVIIPLTLIHILSSNCNLKQLPIFIYRYTVVGLLANKLLFRRLAA